MVNQQARQHRTKEIGNGRAYGQPAEHALEFGCTVGRAADMALQCDGGRAGGTAHAQGGEAQHLEARPQHGGQGAGHREQQGNSHRPLEAVAVRVAPGRNRQKHLHQGKQRQQAAHFERAIA